MRGDEQTQWRRAGWVWRRRKRKEKAGRANVLSISSPQQPLAVHRSRLVAKQRPHDKVAVCKLLMFLGPQPACSLRRGAGGGRAAVHGRGWPAACATRKRGPGSACAHRATGGSCCCTHPTQPLCGQNHWRPHAARLVPPPLPCAAHLRDGAEVERAVVARARVAAAAKGAGGVADKAGRAKAAVGRADAGGGAGNGLVDSGGRRARQRRVECAAARRPGRQRGQHHHCQHQRHVLHVQAGGFAARSRSAEAAN